MEIRKLLKLTFVGIIRTSLTVLLLYGVFTETGVYTTLVLGLITLEMEVRKFDKKSKNGRFFSA